MKTLRRRWEILIFKPLPWWRLMIVRLGFATEVWVGPFMLRVWKDPRSVTHVRKAVIIVKYPDCLF